MSQRPSAAPFRELSRLFAHALTQRQMAQRIVATDITPPVITINEPLQNQLTRDATVQVSGNVRDETVVNITVNGAQATVSAAAPGTVNFSATASLPNEGNNAVLVRATNAAGLTTDSTRTVIKDTQAPQLTVTAPADNLITNADSVTVTGSVSDHDHGQPERHPAHAGNGWLLQQTRGARGREELPDRYGDRHVRQLSVGRACSHRRSHGAHAHGDRAHR